MIVTIVIGTIEVRDVMGIRLPVLVVYVFIGDIKIIHTHIQLENKLIKRRIRRVNVISDISILVIIAIFPISVALLLIFFNDLL